LDCCVGTTASIECTALSTAYASGGTVAVEFADELDFIVGVAGPATGALAFAAIAPGVGLLVFVEDALAARVPIRESAKALHRTVDKVRRMAGGSTRGG